ncbi:MAG: hypothetical protein COC15_00405 [Legionellales bacterium]|nr:MAG: hypothetical protein COC15_00405 [Legionellales bacterium]
MKNNRGIALISAIFILVVLSVAAAAIVRIAGISSITSTLGLDSTRAYFAAKTGIEWGAMQIMNSPISGTCSSLNGLAVPNAQAGLKNFTIDVFCIHSGPFDESGVDVNIFTITSVAQKGTMNTVDYVRRTVEMAVTVSN